VQYGAGLPGKDAEEGMQSFEFRLDLSPEQYLPYYRGTVRRVLVRCVDGRVMEIPAALLRRFVSSDGVHGQFVLTCGDDMRGARLQRL
jgi:hypothetical protein